MVSFSLRQRIFLPPPTGPSPVSFHLSQFAGALLLFSGETSAPYYERIERVPHNVLN
jgi:hypothetical protein